MIPRPLPLFVIYRLKLATYFYAIELQNFWDKKNKQTAKLIKNEH